MLVELLLRVPGVIAGFVVVISGEVFRVSFGGLEVFPGAGWESRV